MCAVTLGCGLSEAAFAIGADASVVILLFRLKASREVHIIQKG